ncbi:MAG: serine hydrolase domain-containing protein [Actinomycetota bacterium]
MVIPPVPARRGRGTVCLVAASLVVASCGGDGGPSESGTNESSAVTPAVTTAPRATTAEATTISTTTTTTTTPTTTTTTTTTIAATTTPTAAPAPPPLRLDEDAVRQALAEFVDTTDAPGVLAAIQIGEGPPTLLAAGIDDTTTGTPMAPDRSFRIGSVSKVLLAAVLFEAVDAGRLSLDDRLGDYVEGVTNPDATIAQVLAHDAGLADWDALGDGGIRELLVPNIGRDWEPGEIVEEVKALPAVSEPGGGYSYSNPGFQMLGAIVEQVNGEPFDASLERVIGDGRGLTDIAFGPFDTTPDDLVFGYGDLGGNLVESRMIPAVGIDSLFYTTGAGYADLDDLVAFSRLYWSADSPLTPDGVDVAVDVSGGSGLATQFIADGLIGHTGDVFGSRTLAAHDRDRDVTLAINANTNVIERDDVVELAVALLAAVS